MVGHSKVNTPIRCVDAETDLNTCLHVISVLFSRFMPQFKQLMKIHLKSLKPLTFNSGSNLVSTGIII